MTADEVKRFAKRFSYHITVVVLILIPIYLYLDAKWDKMLKFEKELYGKEVVLKQNEVELTTKSKSNDAFYEALREFNLKSADVDLSTEIQCAEPYMSRYREAETRLNALEGMAKETGKYQSYAKFFREKRGWIHTLKNACDK